WQHPVPARRFTLRHTAAGLPGMRSIRSAQPNRRRLRNEAVTPMCGDSPDYSVLIACAEAEETLKKPRDPREPRSRPDSERRPWPGRRRETTSGLATKRAPSLSSRLAATD